MPTLTPILEGVTANLDSGLYGLDHGLEHELIFAFAWLASQEQLKEPPWQ
jgi:hypothetical protein